MKKLFLITVIGFAACTPKKEFRSTSTPVQSAEQNQFLPDTSIGSIFFLAKGVSNTIYDPTVMLLDTAKTLPTICFLYKEQYVKCIFHPGSTKYTFNAYEVGYIKELATLEKCYALLPDGEFAIITESGIKLGMNERDLILLKGGSFQKQVVDSELIFLNYKLNNYESSPFLKRYNMPSYFSNYYFKKDSLTRFEFGFDYE